MDQSGIEQNSAVETPATQDSGVRLLTTQEVEGFEKLSLEVFGSTSRWSTLLKKGIAQPVTETITEYVPATESTPEETRTHQVPVYLDKARKSVQMRQVYFTPETLTAFMLERKRQIEEFKAMVAKMQAEEKARKEQEARDQETQRVAQSVQQAAAGSAV